jgi:1,4-dihydroxy-2-naphthoate octaprenyltransferase
MCYVGINKYDLSIAMNPVVIFGGLLTTLMLWANYPMTQIYQHEEDAKHGDETISMQLGINGTFLFTGALFALAAPGFFFYLSRYFSMSYSLVFLAALSPVVVYFAYWFMKTQKDKTKADYTHTMWLNLISATCLNTFFIYLFLDYTHVLRAL